jgi:hypothetical protein
MVQNRDGLVQSEGMETSFFTVSYAAFQVFHAACQLGLAMRFQNRDVD